MLTHRNLASNALTLVDRWGFTHDDVLLHALPLYHVHGLFVACHCALLSGARMLWHAKFDARERDRIAAARDRHDGRADVLFAPARRTRLRRLGLRDDPPVRLGLGAAAARDLRRVRGAHRPHHPRALRHDRNRHEHVESARRRTPLRQRRPASARDIGARRRRARGRRAAPGEVGGIQVKGPNVFAGYWRMPEKTREEFTADGYFKTGDMGQVDARRLPEHRRSRQGPDHHRRSERVPEGDRGTDRRAAGCGRVGRHRRSRSRFRRSRDRDRRRPQGQRAYRGRASSRR